MQCSLPDKICLPSPACCILFAEVWLVAARYFFGGDASPLKCPPSQGSPGAYLSAFLALDQNISFYQTFNTWALSFFGYFIISLLPEDCIFLGYSCGFYAFFLLFIMLIMYVIFMVVILLVSLEQDSGKRVYELCK